MKIRPVFIAGAVWIGVHRDFERRRVLIMPVPCFGLLIQLPHHGPTAEVRAAARTLRQLARVLRRKAEQPPIAATPPDLLVVIATIQATQEILADNLDDAATQMENPGA